MFCFISNVIDIFIKENEELNFFYLLCIFRRIKVVQQTVVVQALSISKSNWFSSMIKFYIHSKDILEKLSLLNHKQKPLDGCEKKY